MSSLMTLVYASTARTTDEEVVQQMVEQAARNNARDGITGILLLHDGRFLQYLEGSRADVSACYVRIVADSRHRDCVMLHFGPTDRRAFPDWSMVLLEPDESVRARLQTVFNLLRAEDSPSALRTSAAILAELQQIAAAVCA